MRTNALRVLALVFALGALLAVAQPAAACTQMCERIPGTFCRQCVDTGEFTGVTCQQSGPCACFFTQNNCFAGAAADGEDQPEFLAEPAVMTPFVPQLGEPAGEDLPPRAEV